MVKHDLHHIPTRSKQDLVRTYLIIAAMSTVAFVVRFCSGAFTLQLNIVLFFTSLGLVSITWEAIRYTHYKLNHYYPFEERLGARIALQLSVGVAISVVLRYVIYRFAEPYLPLRLDTLFLASTWVLYGITTVIINTVFFAAYFLDRWKDSLVRAERLEKEKALVQFDNLKNQLNPHFLFNALTSLQTLIADDPQLATRFLQHMSKVYRYVLEYKDRNLVAVATEYEFIQNYVFLAKTRFDKALNIRFQLSPEAMDKEIVPVTLQILLENAMKHNVITEDQPLTIDVIATSHQLSVINNLQPRKLVESSNKQGLENLKSLYAFLSTRLVEVEATSAHFTVKIPLL